MPPGESEAIAETIPAESAPTGKLTVALIVIGVILTLDILTKMWVVQNLAMHYSQTAPHVARVCGLWAVLTRMRTRYSPVG